MQQSLTGQEAGLVGYWPLNTITAEGTPDLTGNHPVLSTKPFSLKTIPCPLVPMPWSAANTVPLPLTPALGASQP